MLLTTTVLLLVAAVGNSHVIVGDARYQLLSEPMTWKEAEQNCRALGMQLVNIDSVEEQRLLQTLTPLEDGSSVWVGMLDREAQGRFLAKSGELFPEIPHLLPSMEDDKDCIALHRLHGVYVTSCMGESLPSICSAKPRPLVSDVTDNPTNLKSSIRRLIRSVENSSTARPRKHKRRKSVRRSKRRRKFMRRRKYFGVKVTGKATGNMEGFIRGRSMGTATGVMSGSLRGSLTGIFEGNATGEITGFMKGTFDDEVVDRWTDGTETGDFTGRMFGDFEGRAHGVCIGEWRGSVVGNLTGEFEGQMTGGTFIGNRTGTFQGQQHEYDPDDDEDFTGFLGSSIDFIGTEPTHPGANTQQRAVYLLESENIGNMTGEMWGECTGDSVGNLDGLLEGSSLKGAMEGIMNGTMTGNMTGTLTGIATGNLTDLETGEVRYEENYSITDEEDVNLIGELIGENRGSLVGSMNGSLIGHLTGHFTGTSFGVLQGKLWGTVGGLFDGDVETEDLGVSSNLV